MELVIDFLAVRFVLAEKFGCIIHLVILICLHRIVVASNHSKGGTNLRAGSSGTVYNDGKEGIDGSSKVEAKRAW